MTFDQPRAAVEADITRALTDSSDLEFEWGAPEGTVCELHGTYQRRPARIRVSREQGTARANFTAAHEFGHHLQYSDPEWALDVLAPSRRDHPTVSQHVEEAVSNRVAVKVLMPDHVVESAWCGRLTPGFILALTQGGKVSRQAASMRASAYAAVEDPHAVVIVADPISGVVFSSVSDEHSALARPPKGSVQPDLRTLTSRQQQSVGATEGLVYGTGSARSDVTYDWGWDAPGVNIFVVARPTYRFGSAQWDRDMVSCVSATCDSAFARADATFCDRCGEYICPDCGACGCEKKHGKLCLHCFTEMSLAEAQRGSRHSVCPI
ncbi:ImmA/IrrE family metallo-endopeptidase [Microbacterium sp. NPDC090007]|uniref:ImmA/IrrE family metallo-endopeptidase n=1 Tax=Microbacterium sp. NPDC090007 TaxID=3364204 RepID=UPI00380A5A5E